MDKKICVLFGDEVEEIELVTPVDVFRRCGFDVTLVSAANSTLLKGAHGIGLMADKTMGEVRVENFDVLLLPGGPGSFTLKDDIPVLEFVGCFAEQGKLICAICAAPLILWNAKILDGRRFCSHPCTHDTLKNADRNARVVVDGTLITAKGPGAAAEFALAIVEFLRGKSVATKVREDLFF